MNLTCTHHQHCSELVLEGAMTIMEAVDLRDALAEALFSAHGPVQLDLSRVTALDSAGLQLLIDVVRARDSVQLVALSEVVSARVARFGLTAVLRLEGEQHGA